MIPVYLDTDALTPTPLLDAYYALGLRGIRVEVNRLAPSATDTALEITRAHASNLAVACIVWTPEQVDWVASAVTPGSPPVSIGALNEPDIGTDIKLTAAGYASIAGAIAERAAHFNLPCYIGETSAADQGTHAYLHAVLNQLKRGVPFKISAHRYPAGRTFDIAMPPYASRDDEASALVDLARMYDTTYALTETGLWTAPQCHRVWGFLWTSCFSWSDQTVAAWARQEIALWDRHGADFLVWYQINDDPTRPTQKEATFGIRYNNPANAAYPFDWKPVAAMFAAAPA